MGFSGLIRQGALRDEAIRSHGGIETYRAAVKEEENKTQEIFRVVMVGDGCAAVMTRTL